MLEGQEGVTWPQWLAMAEAAESLGFEALFTSDHYLSVQGSRERGSSDAWTMLPDLEVDCIVGTPDRAAARLKSTPGPVCSA